MDKVTKSDLHYRISSVICKSKDEYYSYQMKSMNDGKCFLQKDGGITKVSEEEMLKDGSNKAVMLFYNIRILKEENTEAKEKETSRFGP